MLALLPNLPLPQGSSVATDVAAPDGFVLNSPANILQNFWESGVTSGSGYNSGTVGVQ